MLEHSILAWGGGGAGLLLIGEILALRNVNNLKRVLLFSTIAEIGYIGLGIGLGSFAAETGAFLHIGLQSVMRLLVFISACVLIKNAGSSSLNKLSGKWPKNAIYRYDIWFWIVLCNGTIPPI